MTARTGAERGASSRRTRPAERQRKHEKQNAAGAQQLLKTQNTQCGSRLAEGGWGRGGGEEEG